MPVTVRTALKRTVGYNFRFSVPKSVSLLYAISGDQRHPGCVPWQRSMRRCARWKAEMKTRVRKGSQDTEPHDWQHGVGGIHPYDFLAVDGIWDPQLQCYLFVFNMTWDEQEDCWKAGASVDLKRDAPYFQAAFRVRLANKLQDLGFGVERDQDDFEIAGIPSDVLKRFSRRTAVIEKLAQERGITDPTLKSESGPRPRKGE